MRLEFLRNTETSTQTAENSSVRNENLYKNPIQVHRTKKFNKYFGRRKNF